MGVRMKNLMLLLVCMVLLSACSNPKNYEVSKLTDDQRKELGKKLTADEGQKLSAWIMRNGLLGKDIPVGTTVEQAIKEQDEWLVKVKDEEARADELKKRVEAERKAKQEEFSRFLTVALVSKVNKNKDYGQRWVSLEIAFDNKSDKDIRGIKGVLKLTDIFDDKIMHINWSFDQGIPAKRSVVERGSGVDINQFMDPHMKLWNTDFDKLKSSFEINTIIFKDGTKINSPE